MEENHKDLMLACVISATLFSVLGLASFSILWAVNWRPWRIYSWIYSRKWPSFLQGPQLGILSGFLSLCAWLVVISPIEVLITRGCWLIVILGRDLIGLAVIMAGTALLLAFYSIMLWWRTQWQSSKAIAVLLLLAVALLCGYEICAVYVTAGSTAPQRYSPSGFFFGVSAIALAINMLFICRMVFNGNGLDVDEYVQSAYKFAYSDCIEVGPVACLPEPPDPNDLYPRQSRRVSHLGLLYLGSLLVLLVYSISYDVTAKEANWLGAITSAAVIILDWNMGACLYGFELLQSRVIALFVAGTSRVFLICFGVHYWYLGHCISYAVVGSVLLGAAVTRHLSVTNPLAARRDALQSTVIRFREGFRRKEQNSSSTSSGGCGSSVKRSSSAETGHLGNNWNNVELVNSEKSLDSGRPSLALRSSSCRSVIHESATGNFDPNGSLVVCSSSGMESQGCESNELEFEFGCAVLLLSLVICSIMAFLRSLQAEDMAMTSKPRKYGFIAWLLSTSVGEEIDMRSAQAQIDLASLRLWSQLLRFKQEGFLLGAGSPSGSDVHISSSGIVQGHAYSLLQVREVDGHKLVQIRNPWANEVEWNWQWSDSSPEWTERMKHKLKHVPRAKDGIFWMSWQDFQIHFRSIYVCRVYPPEMRYSVHGQWRGYSVGGCQDYDTWHQNPQFRIRATGSDANCPIHVFITLTQGVSFSRTTPGFRNYQSSHDSLMFYIGMRIIKTRGRRAAYNIYLHESVGGTDYINSREISCEMVFEPDPRGYTIVPTTIHPGEEAPFVLSVFTKASITLEAL